MSEAALLRRVIDNLPELMARVRNVEVRECNGSSICGYPFDCSKAPADGDLWQFDSQSGTWLHSPLPTDIGVGQAGCSAQLALTNAWQDVAGCTKALTFNAGETLVVLGIFDFEMQYTSSTNYLSGALVFDGSRQSRYAWFEGGGAGERGTVSQLWIIAPGTGAKTFKLQAKRTTAGAGDWCQANGTTMYWMRTTIFTDES